MKTKFSEDVISLSDLKVNPGKIVNRTKDSHRPICLLAAVEVLLLCRD